MGSGSNLQPPAPRLPDHRVLPHFLSRSGLQPRRERERGHGCLSAGEAARLKPEKARKVKVLLRLTWCGTL